MNQLVLPMDFSDLIPENHVALVVNDMVEQLDDQLFDEVYKGGGRPAYHPKMMTKSYYCTGTRKIVFVSCNRQGFDRTFSDDVARRQTDTRLPDD